MKIQEEMEEYKQKGIGVSKLPEHKKALSSYKEEQLGGSIKVYLEAKNLSLEEFLRWFNERYNLTLNN